MSHFSVMVIGDNFDEQLRPFQRIRKHWRRRPVHVVLIFLPIQHVVALHTENVGQENMVSKSDFRVLNRGTV